jgi:site-specific recombinase XerD
VRKGDLKASTASLYMQHIISFYEWAAHEKLIIVCPESKPFEYETIEIANYGMMKHINNSFSIKSTDLRIRVPNRTVQQSLNPLSEKELEVYGESLKQCNIEFRLHQLLQLNAGLRVMEACTFPLELVAAPPYERRRLDIAIGPHNGVQTKYGATRTIEIGAVLMHQLYLYATSERRLKKSSKHSANDQVRPLLLNKNGTALTANSVQNHFLRLRNKISDQNRGSFQHKTHDLRATYGTYRLASLLGHIPESDAIALLMNWLGHKNESTTWKYIRFLRKESVNQSAILMLDGILEDALA